VEEKYLRVANYVQMMNKEIEMIALACGLKHARELAREGSIRAGSIYSIPKLCRV
jgi:glutamate synthase domain-containing protein 2